MALRDDPGFVFSGFTHVVLLGAALVSFASAPKLEDAQEAMPVEMLTTDQFNKITKGDKTAEKPMPKPKADKLAQVTETKPLPPVAEAKQDVPTPPPPLKRQVDPGEAETPEKAADAPTPPPRPTPEPPKPVAQAAPPKPEPPKPTPRPEIAKAAPLPPERPDPEDAEPVRPKPPPRPKIEQAKAEPKPEPKKPEVKKPDSAFKPDQLAKLLAQQPVEKPASRPKSGDETEEPRRFNLADISQLLSRDMPQRRASTGRELQQVASLGAPTASATQMSPSLWAALDGYLQDQYKQCWTYLGLGAQQKYVPEIRVQYAQDGGLVGRPTLMNPPTDANLRGLAESALRAVRKCDPLKIPAQFQPYYEQWKGRIVRFDPETML